MINNNPQVYSSYLTGKWGCDILDEGFTAIPNLFLKNYAKLGISDKTAMFIIQVVSAPPNKWVTDKNLCMDASRKTLQRIRTEIKNLKDDDNIPLVEIKQHLCHENGKIKSIGSSYNFGKLIDYIVKKYVQKKENVEGQNGRSAAILTPDLKNINKINELTPPPTPIGELTPENQQKITPSKNLKSNPCNSYPSPNQTPVLQELTPYKATQKKVINPELKIKYSEWDLVPDKLAYTFENPDNIDFLNQTDKDIALSLLEIMKDDEKREALAYDIEQVNQFAKDEKVNKAVIKKLINIAFIIDKFTSEQYQKAFDIAKKRGKEQSLSYLRKVLEKAFMPMLYAQNKKQQNKAI